MHTPTPEQQVADLKRRFAYHPPKDEGTKNAHEAIRAAHHEAAANVVHFCPPGREQSLAITKLEEAMMWANAGIARAGSDEPPADAQAPDEGSESAAERF